MTCDTYIYTCKKNIKMYQKVLYMKNCLLTAMKK